MSQVDITTSYDAPSELPVVPTGVLELAALLRPTWDAIDAGLRASGVPLCEGDAGAGAGDTTDGDTTTADDAAAAAAAAAGDEPQTFDRKYVEGLRRENAAARKRAQDAEARAKEYEDRDKTEQQKLAEQAQAAGTRADEAETRLLRYEVAAEKNVPTKLAKFLSGSSKEELERSADELLAELGDQTRTSFDGGAREGQVPAGDMDAAIRRAAGRS